MDLIPPLPSRPAAAPPRSLDGHFIPFAFPGVPHVGCAFTTSLAGSMGLFNSGVQATGPEPGKDAQPDDPVANRRRIMARLGITAWAEFHQVHGTDFIVDPAPTNPAVMPGIDADGGCTRRKETALIIKTADCQPVLFTNRAGTAIAALHAGWRGNAMDYPGIGLSRFCEAYDLDPKDVLTVRGPSLGPGAAEFVNFEAEWPPSFRPWFDEARRSMDLWSLLRHQLAKAGMRPENIYSLDMCTWSLPELFFSHRRGHGGRQISAIWIKEA